MRFAYIGILILYSVCYGLSQSVQFYSGSLDNAVAIAELRNRPIYVDFMTPWCKPCHDMTIELYRDEQISHDLNNQYVTLRIDAESDAGRKMAKEFNISGFPSLVFLDKKGNLIRKQLGFVSKNGFKDILETVASFHSDERIAPKLDLFRNNMYDKNLLEELANLTKDYDFEGKQELIQVYFYTLTATERNQITDFLVSNIQFLNTQMLKTAIDNYQGPSGFFISTGQREAHERILQEFEQKLSALFDREREQNDFSSLQVLTDINLAFAEKNYKFDISKQLEAKKENELLTLRYYEVSQQKMEYAALAARIIDRYIFHVKPADMRKQDGENYVMTNVTTKPNYVTKPENQPTGHISPSADSLNRLKEIYANSYEAAELLDRISRNCLKFFRLTPDSTQASTNTNDGLNLEKETVDKGRYMRLLSDAVYWSSMSYRYFPLAEYYVTHARLVLELGDEKIARQIINEGLAQGGPNSEAIKTLQSMLNRLGPPEPE